MGKWQIIRGDVLETLEGELLDELGPFDAKFGDPPYGLTSGGNGGGHDIARGLSKICLPDFGKAAIEFVEHGELHGIPVHSATLSRCQAVGVVGSGVSVPIGAVDLDDGVDDGNVEVCTSDERSGVGVSDAELINESVADDCEFMGDYFLDVRHLTNATGDDGHNGLSPDYGLGSIGVPVSIACDPCNPSALAGAGSVVLRNENVRSSDHAGSDAERSAGVVASGTTVNTLVLRFDVRRRTIELDTASRALQGDSHAHLGCPQLVRAGATARRLTTNFEPVRVGLVFDAAHGTCSRYFHLWVHSGWVGKIAKILPKAGFMGKAWDHGVPSAEVYRAGMRHLRPGANVLQFGGPRTSHRLTCSIEDAGFEIRDRLYCWLYGSGWPKPANVSKFIDKRLGKDRAIIGESRYAARAPRARAPSNARAGALPPATQETAPGSPEAALFDGYHANLAPACEPAVLARKPLDGTLANNAMVHGLAGLNVDGCRIEADGRPALMHSGHTIPSRHSTSAHDGSKAVGTTNLGRWPSNVILTCDEAICGPGDPRAIEHQAGCHVFEMDGQSGGCGGDRPSAKALRGDKVENNASSVYGQHAPYRTTTHKGEGTTASRFFYCAKVSKSERGVSAHPCMKPVKLCEYFARLLLPPPRADGQPRRILVPYSGSGSEMIGALAAGWDVVVGIEWDASAQNPGKRPDYWADVAEHRIREWEGSLRGEHVKADVVGDKAQQLGLWG